MGPCAIPWYACPLSFFCPIINLHSIINGSGGLNYHSMHVYVALFVKRSARHLRVLFVCTTYVLQAFGLRRPVLPVELLVDVERLDWGETRVPGAKAQPSPSGKRAERTAASGQGHRRSAPPPRGLHESTREACATSPKRSRVEMTQPPTSSTPHLRLCFATRRRYPCTVRPSHRRNSHRLLLLLAVPSRPRSSCRLPPL